MEVEVHLGETNWLNNILKTYEPKSSITSAYSSLLVRTKISEHWYVYSMYICM